MTLEEMEKHLLRIEVIDRNLQTILKRLSLNQNEEEIGNIQQAVVWTGISESKLYKLSATKGVPTIRVGGKLLFSKSQLQNWMLTKSKPARLTT